MPPITGPRAVLPRIRRTLHGLQAGIRASGKALAFAVLAGIAVLVAGWTAGYAALTLGRPNGRQRPRREPPGRHGPHGRDEHQHGAARAGGLATRVDDGSGSPAETE